MSGVFAGQGVLWISVSVQPGELTKAAALFERAGDHFRLEMAHRPRGDLDHRRASLPQPPRSPEGRLGGSMR